MPLSQLAKLRQLAYHLFASMLLYPDPQGFTSILCKADLLACESGLFVRFAFWDHWDKFLASLREFSSSDRASLEAEYIRNFTLTSHAQICLACESAYVQPQAVGMVMAELEREYASAGFSLASEFKEPPDHVSSELEFMGLLCGEEAAAWRQKAFHQAVNQMALEANFIEHHLYRWLPLFARQVARVDRSGFYTIAADTAQAFLEHDKELLAVLIQRFQRREAGVVGC